MPLPPTIPPQEPRYTLKRKSWLIRVDAMDLSDPGNVCDVLFLPAWSVLLDTEALDTGMGPVCTRISIG